MSLKRVVPLRTNGRKYCSKEWGLLKLAEGRIGLGREEREMAEKVKKEGEK